MWVSNTAVGTETVQTATPISAATINIASGKTALLITPAGTIAALTINMPSSPVDGQSVTISSSQIVTVLTMGGGTILGALSAMAVAGFARYIYNASTTSWYRAG